MTSELIIDSTAAEVNIALLEDKKLVELNREKKDSNFTVGDVYLGRVKKLLPNLRAAFIDIGFEKEGFLHYTDLGPQFGSLSKFIKRTTNENGIDPLLHNFDREPDIHKAGKIQDILAVNQWLLVQIAKEPISSKGHRLTSEISLPGRYVVITPFSDTLTISSKIKGADERNRLKKLASSIRPRNFGMIVRTAAEGKKVADLDKDIQDILDKWKKCIDMLKTVSPPFKVIGEMDRTSTILRDLLNANFNNIHVNDPVMYDEVRNYMRSIAPDQLDIVKLFRNKVPIFEHFAIDKQIKTVFGKTVNMPGGSYLVIEHTEAMHVIDVNSGIRPKQQSENIDEHALQVNLSAAREIARQLRLRDMGGIIVVDFIDMRNPNNRKVLYEALREEMKRDRSRHTILPPSKFGLVQITRERERPETKISIAEKCPACDGTGEVKPTVLLLDEIESNLRYFFNEQNEKSLKLSVHPYLHAYLTKGFISIQNKWRWHFKKSVRVEPNKNYHMLEFHFFNDNGDEIKI